MWHADRRVSWSMVSLLLSLSGALLLAAIIWVPPALGRDSGVRPIQPGLLVVAPEASGVVTLGSGRAAQLDGTGLRITNGGGLLFRTVRGGSPLSALFGEVEGSGSERSEEVSAAASNLEIDRLAIEPGEVTWSGRLTGDGQSVPASIVVRLEGARLVVTATAKGADAVVVHSHQELATRGRQPGLPDRLLRKRAWWVGDGPAPVVDAYSTELGVTVGLGPRGRHRGVDLRRMGHTDLHAWAPSATLTMTSYRRVVEE
ncbi:hypothetical protein [Janibacter anophelis]|uniref:hypothetical protein n=1 Tax=Janibacter anophelis TaxID=319054 RepID=UPI0012ED25F0|nr:hypothetical protein [Janibacter anophelis]